MSFMLGVTFKSKMLRVIVLSIIIMNAVAPFKL